VFSGRRGGYVEDDLPDPPDLYGRTKLLGELDDPRALTLRTSIIGHGLQSNKSLIDWFLTQEEKVLGYTKAIYTGFPTVEVARILHKLVIPQPSLRGVYHLSSEPISKYDLLCQVARVYRKKVDIVPDDSVVIDRSLNSTKFRTVTGYQPPHWPALVRLMRDEFMKTRALSDVASS
jgi:dTDP-4-dehydrorhamnose reductase